MLLQAHVSESSMSRLLSMMMMMMMMMIEHTFLVLLPCLATFFGEVFCFNKTLQKCQNLFGDTFCFDKTLQNWMHHAEKTLFSACFSVII